jgi:hypothetical protein
MRCPPRVAAPPAASDARSLRDDSRVLSRHGSPIAEPLVIDAEASCPSNSAIDLNLLRGSKHIVERRTPRADLRRCVVGQVILAVQLSADPTPPKPKIWEAVTSALP